MTLAEAKKIAAIAQTADGGCCSCVRDLGRKLARGFPKFDWLYSENPTGKSGFAYDVTLIAVPAGTKKKHFERMEAEDD